VCIMQMEAGLDTGPVFLSAAEQIPEDMTAGELHDILSDLSAELLVEAVEILENSEAEFTPQPEEGATYASKLTNDESRIDWTKISSDVRCHIHGLSPFPGAWFEMETSKGTVRVKVLQVEEVDAKGEAGELLDDTLLIACGEGAVRLLNLQKAGKSAMSAEDFLRGNDLPKGLKLA